MSDERFNRLEDKLDRLVDTVGGIRAEVKVLQVTLDAHDAKGAVALQRAEEARLLATQAKEPLLFIERAVKYSKWLAVLGGAIGTLYTLVLFIRG